MGGTGIIGRIEGTLAGALIQLVNSVTDVVGLPFTPVPGVPVGDVIEPVGDAARAAANAVEALIDKLRGVHRVDPQQERDGRALLASADVAGGAAGTATRLRFDATAPGCDWGHAGHESTMVAIYVDGRYHSTVTVMSERTGGYAVNLGSLPPGEHHVEVRSAAGLAGPAAAVAGVSNLRAETLTGDEAEVALHAPLVELRDDMHGGATAAACTDTPLVMVPSVRRAADGTKTIDYRIIFSNEDGGTPIAKLMSMYGRGVDSEIVYSVRLDARGKVIGETYQAPVHRWLAFDGGHEGGRPVLRLSTRNNMVSARVHAGAERWSDATIAPVGADSNDQKVMNANAWTWAVMGKELLREGKPDARRYLYLNGITDAQRAAIVLNGGLQVELAGGRHAFVKAGVGCASSNGCTALELPSNVTADAVAGVKLAGVHSFVLDAAFAPRLLPDHVLVAPAARKRAAPPRPSAAQRPAASRTSTAP